MTHQEVLKMMDEMKLPHAYHHFVEGESPEPPFLVFLYPNSDNFAADGMVYFKVNRLNIELYTDLKGGGRGERGGAGGGRGGRVWGRGGVWVG